MSESENKTKRTNNDTIKEAKNIVEISGRSLGNLINEIYSGKIINDNWKDNEQSSVNEEVKETKYYILGGSIGSNGYTSEIIPLHAKKKLVELGREDIEILPTSLDSFNAGSLGASYAFVVAKMMNLVEKKAKAIILEKKIPIIPLLDIGGTKINLILAHFDIDGKIINKEIENQNFPTPRTSDPKQFYKDIISYIISL